MTANAITLIFEFNAHLPKRRSGASVYIVPKRIEVDSIDANIIYEALIEQDSWEYRTSFYNALEKSIGIYRVIGPIDIKDADVAYNKIKDALVAAGVTVNELTFSDD